MNFKPIRPIFSIALLITCWLQPLALHAQTPKPKNILKCTSEPVVLDNFVAHETDLVSHHDEPLNKVVRKIVKSFGYCKLPYDYVELVGHAAPWKDLPVPVLQERSRIRAEKIRDILLTRLTPSYRKSVRTNAYGVGPEIPVANNETQAGRAKNRRVEIRLCRTYRKMVRDFKKVKRKDFEVYPDDLRRVENRCMVRQIQTWAKNPSTANRSLRRLGKEVYGELYGTKPKGCDAMHVRTKVATKRKELKRILFHNIERDYKDFKAQMGISGGAMFSISDKREVWKSKTCKTLRKFRERAKDSNDLLYCFSERINDPERFDLCLSEKP